MENWQNDKYVQNWFELLHNERTIKNYSREFPKFLDWMAENTEYKTPTDIINSRLEHLTTKDLLKRRFWEMQVVKFKNSLEEKNLRMATIHGYLRTVQSFFSKNGVKLSFSRGELKINPSEADKVDNEWIPSNEDVRLLYRLCDNARDRAILLTLYQSGFSEVDVANMKIEEFPFYDENGEWQIPITEDLYQKRRREKTNQWQQTCISREALEEIRIMLQSRGFPQEGYLFVSFRDQQLGVRGINDMLKGVVKKGFNGKSKLWKTKHLRDAFMNGLLQAKLTQETKDAMVGHKRRGARNDYAITELTIKTAYQSAFKYLTINGYGSQSRKLEQLEKSFNQKSEEQNREIKALRTILLSLISREKLEELVKAKVHMKGGHGKFDIKKLSDQELLELYQRTL
jgi:site-specific recombinase XerD